ncbi:hypothetical protein LTR85_000530 [Meristemomyces frigidus]|nr:hypothetical protein LTR85_000530 [Meristemomyces frigidus]
MSNLTGAMHQHLWRALAAFLLLVVLLQYFLLFSTSDGAGEVPRRPPHHLPSPIEHNSAETWTFDHLRDADNPALNRAKCQAAFPELYYEIDRSVQYWRDRSHTITQEDTEISWRQDAALRVLVHGNQVRILETRHTWEGEGYRKRTRAVLGQIHRALLGAAAAGESAPTAEFAVTVDDQTLIPNAEDDTHTIWAFSRRLIDGDQERHWLIPDFNFWSSPPVAGAFHEMRDRARVYDAHVVEKKQQVIWRGVKWTNEYVRGSLLNVTEGMPWADVEEVDWENKSTIMRVEDMCRYMFVAHTEGRSWSGRLKYLLNCDSLPIIHSLDWTAHFYHLLTPSGADQNYIPVERDFSDLAEKVEWYMAHPRESQRVVDNAVATFRTRYTTPAAEACYWRRLLNGWSEVAFVPDPYETTTAIMNGTTVEQRRLRGIAFEEFVQLQGNYPQVAG